VRGLLITLLKVGAALLVAKAATSSRVDADPGATNAGAGPKPETPRPTPVPVQPQPTPAPAQVYGNAPLEGTYYTISANPAFPQYRTSREFRFDRSGRFTKGGSSAGAVIAAGVGTGAVVAGASSSHAGAYEVQAGHLVLRYDNGHVERYRFNQESDTVIWLDSTPFMRTRG
jgi:hypothetical protein